MAAESRSGSLASVEKILRQHHALQSLDRLLACGCERRMLLAALAGLRPAVDLDDFREWVGVDRKTLRARLRRLRACADEIEEQHLGIVGLLFQLSKQPAHAGWLDLPRRLREYSDVIERFGHFIRPKGPRKGHAWHIRVSTIVHHVVDRTGKPHDKEVSELINAVLGKEYDVATHKMWRLEHYKEYTSSIPGRASRLFSTASATGHRRTSVR